MRVAIYPGTFDPITYGHIDIIKRASLLFDHIIIATAKDSSKNPLFSLDERLELIKTEIKSLDLNLKNISVMKFEGLLVNFAK